MCKYSKIFTAVAIIVAISFYGYYNHIVFNSHFSLSKTTYNKLPHWENDDHQQALIAFKKSCADISVRKSEKAFGIFPESKTNQSWQTICIAADKMANPDKSIAKQFFETWFIPYRVNDNLNPDGFFTGYYLPLLHGSLKKTKEYSFPIYGIPTDLVKVNLQLFNPALGNKVLVGQLKNNALALYPDRAAINSGALGKNAPVLVWGDNAIDIFIAQIQGSAVVELPNKKLILIGYASSNGRAYTAIGKVLAANNSIEKKNLSMQSIREWLLQHPDQIDTVLNQNASYVFFMFRPEGPLGTEQVPLTQERSLAVDTRYIPLGAPMWVATEVPVSGSESATATYNHLLIAQDTGGAIKGMIRGDIYWGAGDNAAYSAGHMKHAGQYWILLPK